MVMGMHTFYPDFVLQPTIGRRPIGTAHKRTLRIILVRALNAPLILISVWMPLHPLPRRTDHVVEVGALGDPADDVLGLG